MQGAVISVNIARPKRLIVDKIVEKRFKFNKNNTYIYAENVDKSVDKYSISHIRKYLG